MPPPWPAACALLYSTAMLWCVMVCCVPHCCSDWLSGGDIKTRRVDLQVRLLLAVLCGCVTVTAMFVFVLRDEVRQLETDRQTCHTRVVCRPEPCGIACPV